MKLRKPKVETYPSVVPARSHKTMPTSSPTRPTDNFLGEIIAKFGVFSKNLSKLWENAPVLKDTKCQKKVKVQW